MTGITTVAVSFDVGETRVNAINIKPLMFRLFSEYATEARAVKGVSMDVALKRIRMLRQIDYMLDGRKVAMDEQTLMQIPIVAARKITKALDSAETKMGKIIRGGDGISESIGFELATPLAIFSGKPPITELEFIAKTYGDVEQLLSADDNISQTMALLQTIAKPVHGTLTSLPSAAIDAITAGDGVAIAQQVLPRFLGDDDEAG